MKHLFVAALLIAGVAVEWLACFGLVAMRNPYDRLHAIGPANILPPLFVAAAVFTETGCSQESIKAMLIAATVILSSPVITHVLARAAWLRSKRSGEK